MLSRAKNWLILTKTAVKEEEEEILFCKTNKDNKTLTKERWTQQESLPLDQCSDFIYILFVLNVWLLVSVSDHILFELRCNILYCSYVHLSDIFLINT